MSRERTSAVGLGWCSRRLQPALLQRTLKGAATGKRGFTLLELLASMAILGLMVVMLFSVFEQINKAWLAGENRVETFSDARAILDLISRELSQSVATKTITFYGGVNKVYFVAPVSADPANQADLCEVGYEYELQDPTTPTAPINWTMRIRRRLIQPNNSNVTAGNWNIYNLTWWNSFLTQPVPQTFEATVGLATNSVVGLQFQYLKVDGTPFTPPYQSNLNGDKLPYAIIVSLDAVDSRTAARLKLVGGPSAAAGQAVVKPVLRSFQTTVYLPNALP